MIEIFPTPDDVAAAARDLVLTVVANATPGAPVHLVLAGGSTPAALYRLLAQAEGVRWENVHFWFGDERTVGPEHAESNYRMARETLIDEISAPPENVHRMRGEDDAGRAAAAYAGEIRQLVPANDAGIPVFDLILLGMGDDGHTASLFPGTEALAESEALVAANVVPQQETTRITLTYPVLNAARNLLFLVTGAGKADALAAVAAATADAPPAAGVKPTSGELRWYVDQAAAGKLALDD